MAQPEEVAQAIVAAVERGQEVIYVRRIWRLIKMAVIRAIPRDDLQENPRSERAESRANIPGKWADSCRLSDPSGNSVRGLL